MLRHDECSLYVQTFALIKIDIATDNKDSVSHKKDRENVCFCHIVKEFEGIKLLESLV